MDSVLARHVPGDKISLDVHRRDGKRTITVSLCENPQMEVVPYEHASLPITDEIRKFREDWLGSKAAEKLPEMTKWCPTCKRDYVFPLEYCSFDGDTLRVVREGRK